MKLVIFLFCINVTATTFIASAREINFCGEPIPINNTFVSQKLMNVIRQQIPYANLPSLRRDARRYFPMIEYCLKACNMPEDLKYIPIVESGFKNATSPAGAQGFWQLMPETATGWGLQVNGTIDERNDIFKSTVAALRQLASMYKTIRSKFGMSSWVLTAAAYNWGPKNIYDKIESGSNDYFAMKLNPETAVYVYKIIAIKELFEYPELYIKNFQYNVFNPNPVKTFSPNRGSVDKKDFQNLELTVKTNGNAPDDEKIKEISAPKESDLKNKGKEAFKQDAKLVFAQIVGKYQDFKDGDSITIKLKDDLQTLSGFQRKGAVLTGKGWIIENRVYIDLGFNTNNVILYDTDSEQGIALDEIKNKQQVILRVQN